LAFTSERADSLLVTTDEVLVEYLTFFAAPRADAPQRSTNAQHFGNPVSVLFAEPGLVASFLAGLQALSCEAR